MMTLTALEREALTRVLALMDALYFALEDSEEVAEGKFVIEAEHVAKLIACVDLLDELPDDQPGYVMSYNMKAQWALRRLFKES